MVYMSKVKPVNLEMNHEDLVSLSIVLKEQLREYGVRLCNSEIQSGSVEYHPDSHVAKLVELYCRVDRVLCGVPNFANRRDLACRR